MNIESNEELERIVNTACDPSQGSDPLASEPMVAQFRKTHESLRIPTYEAPGPVIDEARAILPEPTRRPVFGRLVFSTLQPLAVRSIRPNSFQMVFEGEDSRIRMMYAPEGSGWEVVGQADGEGWSAMMSGKDLECDPAGRFSFTAKTLSDTELTLIKDDLELHIPSAEEADQGGPVRDR